GQTPRGCESRESVVAVGVEGVTLVDELNMHGVGAEQGDELVEGATRSIRPPGLERAPHSTFAAPREHRPVAGTVGVARGRCELIEVIDGPALLAATQVRLGHGAREPVVALEPPREHDEMLTRRVGFALLRAGEPERELGAEDR